MNTFKDIIDSFGAAALAETFSVQESHIRTMRARNSIPPEYWGLLIARAAEGGQTINYAELRRMRATRRLHAEAQG